MANVTGGRPGIFQLETDLSQIITEASSDVGVIVGEFAKGPVNRRILITNTRDLISLFGNPSTDYGYAGYSAICALETMNSLYVTRVVSPDALCSALLINASSASNSYDVPSSGLIPDAQEVGLTTTAVVGSGDGATVTMASTLTSLSDIMDITDITVGGTSIGAISVNKSSSVWTLASSELSGTASTLDPSTGALSLTFANAVAEGSEVKVFYVATSQDRLFTVVAENTGTWGNSLRVAIENVNATDLTFEIVVNQVSEGVEVELERHLVSRREQLDGYSRQQYLEEVINGNSLYIRVYDNLEHEDTILPNEVASTSLFGGTTGSAVSNADVMEGWDLYSNKQEVKIDILINGGYVSSMDTSIQAKMKSICESRKDCVAILDAPYDELAMYPTTDLVDWKSNIQNFNTSYTALYGPWVQVYDSYNDKTNLPIPASGFVAQVYSRRTRNAGAWGSPAGWNDGIIDSGALPMSRLTHRYTEGQQDLIYSNNMNYLLTEQGVGTCVFGDRNQQVKASALDRVNVRRLLIVLKRAHESYLKFKLFENNTAVLRAEITASLTDYLRGVVARGGLYDFRVYCNDDNNTPNVIDNNQLNVDIYIQPVKSINFIKNEFVITRTGVDFDTIFNQRLPS